MINKLTSTVDIRIQAVTLMWLDLLWRWLKGGGGVGTAIAGARRSLEGAAERVTKHVKTPMLSSGPNIEVKIKHRDRLARSYSIPNLSSNPLPFPSKISLNKDHTREHDRPVCTEPFDCQFKGHNTRTADSSQFHIYLARYRELNMNATQATDDCVGKHTIYW